ncbi:hypothetical protein KY345_02025 [Candidatus Woesearchaeota archaeon]|nr:hypothetical protein [Candidatus Woesearchaeota archaeon]
MYDDLFDNEDMSDEWYREAVDALEDEISQTNGYAKYKNSPGRYSERPVIQKDEIVNLQIELARCSDSGEFLTNLGCKVLTGEKILDKLIEQGKLKRAVDKAQRNVYKSGSKSPRRNSL